MIDTRLSAALRSAGISSSDAFRARFGISLGTFTSAEAIALLTRSPLVNLPAPASVAAEDWEQVCAVVDLVHERPASRSIGSDIGNFTLACAERLGFTTCDEDLHSFATRFDYWARRLVGEG